MILVAMRLNGEALAVTHSSYLQTCLLSISVKDHKFCFFFFISLVFPVLMDGRFTYESF